jgi:hypothetical protein
VLERTRQPTGAVVTVRDIATTAKFCESTAIFIFEISADCANCGRSNVSVGQSTAGDVTNETLRAATLATAEAFE